MHAWTGRQSGAQPTQRYKWILDTSLDTKAHRRWWSRYSPPSIWPTVPREPSVQGGCFFTSRWTESNWEGCPTFADVTYFVAFWTDKVHLAALRSSIPRSSRKEAIPGKNNASTRKDEITTYLSEMRHWELDTVVSTQAIQAMGMKCVKSVLVCLRLKVDMSQKG